MTRNTKIYIGDGVYAEFDGFGVWLSTERDHGQTHMVYLEPEVMKSLQDFWRSMRGESS